MQQLSTGCFVFQKGDAAYELLDLAIQVSFDKRIADHIEPVSVPQPSQPHFSCIMQGHRFCWLLPTHEEAIINKLKQHILSAIK